MRPFENCVVSPLLDLPFGGHLVLQHAINEANRIHRTQRTKLGDGHYIVHPLHLVMILLSCGFRIDNVHDLAVIVAALLHDSVEDRPDEVTFERIRLLYGCIVERIVRALTLDPEHPDKIGDREAIVGERDWMIQSAKTADVWSNSMRIAASLYEYGFAKTQAILKQPLAERFEMEFAFVSRCFLGYEPPIRTTVLKNGALSALLAMKRAIDTAAP